MRTPFADLRRRAAAAWDANQAAICQQGKQLRFWWNWPRIVEHQSELICGERLQASGWNAGLIRQIRAQFPGRTFRQAISIGGGVGTKEMNLITLGLVEQFDLFEISESRIAAGLDAAKQRHLSHRIRWHRSDGIEHMHHHAHYDLVYWDNSLHHMFDVLAAMAATHHCLVTDGVLLLNDFTGASRFQWSDKELYYASLARSYLDDKYLVHPVRNDWCIPRSVPRPSVEAMMAGDPSEAADSSRIIPSIKEFFPDAAIWPLGGVIYHLALGDVLANFQPGRDDTLLESMLVLDRVVSDMGLNQYTAAIGVKT